MNPEHRELRASHACHACLRDGREASTDWPIQTLQDRWCSDAIPVALRLYHIVSSTCQRLQRYVACNETDPGIGNQGRHAIDEVR